MSRVGEDEVGNRLSARRIVGERSIGSGCLGWDEWFLERGLRFPLLVDIGRW